MTYQPLPHQVGRHGTNLAYESALELYEAGDRTGLSHFLTAIDSNGCYTDEAMVLEFGAPASMDDLWETVTDFDLPCIHCDLGVLQCTTCEPI